MKAAFREAHARGVTIRLISNSSAANNQKIMGRAWDITKHELLALGIDVFEVQEGQFLHAKTIVVDGKKIYIGSYNLDNRSEVLNLENGVFFEDEKMAKLITNHNRRIAKLSHKLTPEDLAIIGEQTGCSMRVIDKLIGLLRPGL
jgi:putative cardiolipin synthase